MNTKMIAGSIIIIMILLVSFLLFFVMNSSGHEEETEWGSWYQEYTAYYVDGGSSSLSIFHNDNEVDSVEYVLKASLNEEYADEATLNFNDFSIQIKNGASVITTIDFDDQFTITPEDSQMTLFTKTMDLSPLKELNNGTYSIDFVPMGTIFLDSETTELPSKASVFIRVGESNDDGNEGEEDKEINFESEIIWN